MKSALSNLIVEESYDAMSRAAANAVLDAVREKPDAVICAATGASPVGVYAELAGYRDELKRVRVLKLDEWGGLPMDDPATCEVYIRTHVLDPWDVSDDHFDGFQGDAVDPVTECLRVQGIIDAWGGIDVAILGMGPDGHIGLNYPAEALPAMASPTDASTLRHAMLKDAKAVPTHGLTLGMGDILRSKRIVLVVNGEAKANAVKRLLSGEITTQFPASLLWLHNKVTCVLDAAAAVRL